MSTNVLSKRDIKRDWHLVNAKNQTLGRLATQIATMLLGKNKVNYVPYLDNGDYVVVTNAANVKVTGKKKSQKKYVRHSGYPGGLTVETFDQLIIRRPEEVIRHAVWGMIPKTKLGKEMIKKLHIFSGNDHKFKKQLAEGKE
jgi:large subunit ribosomal protein L13